MRDAPQDSYRATIRGTVAHTLAASQHGGWTSSSACGFFSRLCFGIKRRQTKWLDRLPPSYVSLRRLTPKLKRKKLPFSQQYNSTVVRILGGAPGGVSCELYPPSSKISQASFDAWYHTCVGARALSCGLLLRPRKILERALSPPPPPPP